VSIFSKIVSGEISAHKIYEDSNHLAFLDIFPMSKGHVLVIPKKEIDYVFDMSDTEYNQLLLFAKKISLAIKKAINCNRVSLNIVGLDVPHVHIHLIPINSISDLNFEKKKLIFSEEEFKEIALLIRDAI